MKSVWVSFYSPLWNTRCNLSQIQISEHSFEPKCWTRIKQTLCLEFRSRATLSAYRANSLSEVSWAPRWVCIKWTLCLESYSSDTLTVCQANNLSSLLEPLLSAECVDATFLRFPQFSSTTLNSTDYNTILISLSHEYANTNSFYINKKNIYLTSFWIFLLNFILYANTSSNKNSLRFIQ